MAHQAHNIPWTVLTSNLKWVLACSCQGDPTNFHLRCKPNQEKELKFFINAFAKNIESHANTEKQGEGQGQEKMKSKTQQSQQQQEDHSTATIIPDPEEVIISDATARKITRLLKTIHPNLSSFCPHPAEDSCRCVLPLQERKMSAFLRKWEENDCFQFEQVNRDAFFNLEVVKALIMYGEMDSVLKVCAHPDVGLLGWWGQRQCECMDADIGWEWVYRLALDAYICLNIVYCFPDTWDTTPRSGTRDYRRTKMYQHMVRRCTLSNRTSRLPTYPHRQFFGIVERQFVEGNSTRFPDLWPQLEDKMGQLNWLERFPYGMMPFEAFLESEVEVGHRANLYDVNEVRHILMVKGLPLELADKVIWLAPYKAVSRLTVTDDPLHDDNRDELLRYLKYCWQLIVRCDMMAKALGWEMNWETEVTESLKRFFDCNCVQKL